MGANHTLAPGQDEDSILEFIKHFGVFGCKKLQIASPHCIALCRYCWGLKSFFDMLYETRAPKNCVAELVLDYSIAAPFKWPEKYLVPMETKSRIIEENKVIYELTNKDGETVFEVGLL